MGQRFTDEELISNYLETQQNDYFEQLYERYCDKVYRQCLLFTKDDVQAKDLTQDIFLRLITRLTGYRHQARFSTWLYSITHNYCTDQFRAPHKRDEFTTVNNWNNINVSADDGLAEQDEQTARHIQFAMSRLSVDEQELLRQKYQEEVSIKDLASQYRLTESAVKMRLKRSRDRLRKLYQQIIAI